MYFILGEACGNGAADIPGLDFWTHTPQPISVSLADITSRLPTLGEG
jgi:hypothetical protein